jgi:sugar/nucleoside kinase (ribokinase family)
LPQRGETISGSRFDTFLGGKGLNQAVAAHGRKRGDGGACRRRRVWAAHS